MRYSKVPKSNPAIQLDRDLKYNWSCAVDWMKIFSNKKNIVEKKKLRIQLVT